MVLFFNESTRTEKTIDQTLMSWNVFIQSHFLKPILGSLFILKTTGFFFSGKEEEAEFVQRTSWYFAIYSDNVEMWTNLMETNFVSNESTGSTFFLHFLNYFYSYLTIFFQVILYFVVSNKSIFSCKHKQIQCKINYHTGGRF